jgi:hypothetical protein
MAAGVEKPGGLTALDEEGFRRVFWPREVQEMWGIGPKLAERMRALGIATIEDLAHAPDLALQAAFGIIGPQLRQAAWGRDETPFTPYHQGVDAKSMGHEVTLPEDCDDPAFLEGTLLRLSDQVSRRLRTEGYLGRTVCVKLRDQHFTTIIRQRVLPEFTADHRRVFETARELWREYWRGGPLPLVGLTVSLLERRSPPAQTELTHETPVRCGCGRSTTCRKWARRAWCGAPSHRRRLGACPAAMSRSVGTIELPFEDRRVRSSPDAKIVMNSGYHLRRHGRSIRPAPSPGSSSTTTPAISIPSR